MYAIQIHAWSVDDLSCMVFYGCLRGLYLTVGLLYTVRFTEGSLWLKVFSNQFVSDAGWIITV